MTAAEVLAAHHLDYDYCSCGWRMSPDTGSNAEHAAHQLDALKAAGFAVVELQKPDGPLGVIDGEESGLAWRRCADPDAPAGGVATIAVHQWSPGEFAAAISCLRTPEDARWAASALLAAADATEARFAEAQL